MDQALVCVSTETDPYKNLATERLLMDAVLPGEQILFLWQNSNTIVIGRNQDVWRECLVEDFERDGGRVARRLSGGGAVFHDKGNLNFTFIAPRESYDLTENLSIICEAVRSFGLAAQLSGRNDIEIDGAKFSGNAFFSTKQARCHHGTLMVAVDTQKLARYLKPDPRKLQQRGVASVQSRVVNLQSLDSSITIGSLGRALLDEFLRRYDAPALPLHESGQNLSSLHKASSAVLLERLDAARLVQLHQHFASDEWRLGRQKHFNQRIDRRYSWGGLDVQLTVQRGHIEQVQVYSDSLDLDFIDALAEAMQGVAYKLDKLIACFDALAEARPEFQTMLKDMEEDIKEMTLTDA